MSEEYAPRDEFIADFEGSALDLLDHWEWNATSNGSRDVEGPAIRSECPHGGEACLVAKTAKPTLRVWFTPYVKARNRTFSGYLLIEPKDRDARLTLTVGVESGDILQDIREVRPFRTDVPAGKWFRFEFPIDEQFPEWRDLAVVTCYVEVQSDKPGLCVSIDDVRVGAAKAANAERK